MSSTIWHTTLYISQDLAECHVVSAVSIVLTVCEHSENLTCSKDDIISHLKIRQGVMSMASCFHSFAHCICHSWCMACTW